MNVHLPRRLAIAIGMCASLGVASATFAQNPVGNSSMRNLSRPTTSPYLNLFNNRNGGQRQFGLNYYQQVRPQQQFRSAFQQQGNQINQLQYQAAQQNANAAGTAQAPTSGLNRTGHPTSFMSYQSFFPGARR